MLYSVDIADKNLALIVVDMQNKFTLDVIRPKALAMVPRINEAIRTFRDAGQPIILVQMEGECHGPYDGPGEPDDFIDGLDTEGGTIFVKREMNAFNGTGLAEYLKGKGIDGALVCGLVANYCVIATYYGAIDCDICPYILRDAVASTHDRNTGMVCELCRTVSLEDALRSPSLGGRA